MSTLVTGDAVVLELPPAGLGARLIAAVLDLLVYGGASFGLSVALWPLAFAAEEATAAAVSLLVSVGCLVVAPTVVETLSRGRSLGKLAMGLRVVRDDGGPIRSRQATVRQLVGFVEVYGTAGTLPVIAMLLNSQGKRVGDMLAGTYVIAERTPMPTRPMPSAPPELASWVRSADLGRIPQPLALAARTVLARRGDMTPEAAWGSMTRVAAQLAPFVAPPPPPGTPPDRFISAVLAERRDRDFARLTAQQRQVTRLRQLADRRRQTV